MPGYFTYYDVAFLQVYEWLYKTDDQSKKSVEKKCKKWKPYSSIATHYFYRALNGRYTKEYFTYINKKGANKWKLNMDEENLNLQKNISTI